jgi:hypothetical protein
MPFKLLQAAIIGLALVALTAITLIALVQGNPNYGDFGLGICLFSFLIPILILAALAIARYLYKQSNQTAKSKDNIK